MRHSLQHFDEEVDEFHRGLQALERQELTPQGIQLLGACQAPAARTTHDFPLRIGEGVSSPAPPSADYEGRRDAGMDRISATLQQFIDLHETGISVGVSRSRESSAQAEAVTEQLVCLRSYSASRSPVLPATRSCARCANCRPISNRSDRVISARRLNIRAPSELRDLVDAVNWMGTKLQELDDMKGEFLAHVSHELRTPMASIQEGTHLLLDEIPGPLSQEQRTTLRIMADSSRRLITLISTILDLSKMDAGMMEYRIVPTDLKRITDMSVNKVQLLADAKHVQLLLEAPAQRVWVMADALRIEQVLDNLLSNALKFSSEGGIVKVLMKPDLKAGVLEVAVTDGGPGIQAEELPYIFERFYQGRTKTKQTAGEWPRAGTGKKSG